MTLTELFDPHPDQAIAIVLPEADLRVSYGDLRSQVRAVAAQLATAGITRGDRVGIALPNGLPLVVALLAASVVGTAAPLNPAYKEDEFRFYLGDTDAKLLILPPDGVGEARRAAGDRLPLVTIALDASNRATLSANGSPIAPSAFTNTQEDDVALVLHTSGSTGRPKRVPLTHANLTISATNVARGYALGAGDV